MKRKIVKLGPATMVVSLPSKWVKEQNVKAGDEIDLEEEHSNLIISTTGKSATKEIRIKINTSVESSIRTLITNTYRLGYTRVIVEYNHEEEFKIISAVIKEQLTGFEIISKTENICTIENVTEPEDKQVENIFLKLLYTITELTDNVEKLMNNEKAIEYINELELRIQRYDNFCRRVASKNSTTTTILRWAFYTELIHAQREVYLIARLITNTKNIKISKEVKEHYQLVKEINRCLKEGYLKKDITILEKIHDLEKKYIYDKGYKLLISKKGVENIIIYRINSAIRNFYLASSPLMGVICLQ